MVNASQSIKKDLERLHERALGEYGKRNLISRQQPPCKISFVHYGRLGLRTDGRKPNICLPNSKEHSEDYGTEMQLKTLIETGRYVQSIVNPKSHKICESVVWDEDNDSTRALKIRGWCNFALTYCALVTAGQIMEGPELRAFHKKIRAIDMIEGAKDEIAYRLATDIATDRTLEEAWKLVPLILRSDLTKLL